METRQLENAYFEILHLLNHRRFAAPASGWTIEMTVAHLIANDRLFVATGTALRRGEKPGYDNRPAVDEARLQRLVDEVGELPKLTAAFEQSSRDLLALARTVTAGQGRIGVRFRVFHAGIEIVDEVRPWHDILTSIGSVHLPMHLRQIENLAVAT